MLGKGNCVLLGGLSLDTVDIARFITYFLTPENMNCLYVKRYISFELRRAYEVLRQRYFCRMVESSYNR